MLFFKLFHKYFRRNVRPIAKDDALEWKNRLSKIYVFIAFNCLGCIIYATHKHDLELLPKNDVDSRLRRFATLAASENIHVVEFKGLSKSNEYDIKRDN